ncbi:hypothetical protein [Nitratireductor aestuarii]|uniref:hypothetical protein n=1 Tax=Nitratireductor aestuarii TaxID=1735103 RepID=UPI00166F5B0A|nr:hypothetical protein [Nitratireductor aestuarii]
MLHNKHLISERRLSILSILVAFLFLGNICYQLHVVPEWKWGPAIHKTPKHTVSDFRSEIFERGKSIYALAAYIDPNADYEPEAFPELVHGSQYRSTQLGPMVSDGCNVVVVHRLEQEGAAPITVIDIIHIGQRGGRIDRMTRYIADGRR